MAGSLSDFSELELLDHITGHASFTMPATPYLALYTVAPTDAGGGTEITGVGNYARLAITGATDWGDAAAGEIANAAAFEFPEASGTNWGELVAFAVFDALTVGNMLFWGDITVPKTINIGDTAKFAIGDLTVTMD